jgi:hypothetical protein
MRVATIVLVLTAAAVLVIISLIIARHSYPPVCRELDPAEAHDRVCGGTPGHSRRLTGATETSFGAATTAIPATQIADHIGGSCTSRGSLHNHGAGIKADAGGMSVVGRSGCVPLWTGVVSFHQTVL